MTRLLDYWLIRLGKNLVIQLSDYLAIVLLPLFTHAATQLRLAQIKNLLLKFLKEWNVAEEIQSQKAFDSALCGELMADDIEICHLGAQAIYTRDFDDGHINKAAGGNDRNIFSKRVGIAADGPCDMGRNDGSRCACVNGQVDHLAMRRPCTRASTVMRFGVLPKIQKAVA